MKKNSFEELLKLLSKLKSSKISYSLDHNREESIMVLVAVPGERWEIEYMSDGSIEVERFRRNGRIEGKNVLEELFKKFSD